MDDASLDDFALEPPLPRGVRRRRHAADGFAPTFAHLWPAWMGPHPERAVTLEIRERGGLWTTALRFLLLAVGAALIVSMYRELTWTTPGWITLYSAGVVVALYGVANVAQWLDHRLFRQWIVLTPDSILYASRSFDPESRPRFRYWANDAARRAVVSVEAAAEPGAEHFVGGGGRPMRRFLFWRLRLRVRGAANPFDMDTNTTAEERKRSTSFFDAQAVADAAKAAEAARDEAHAGDEIVEADLGEVHPATARWLGRQVARWADAPFTVSGAGAPPDAREPS